MEGVTATPSVTVTPSESIRLQMKANQQSWECRQCREGKEVLRVKMKPRRDVLSPLRAIMKYCILSLLLLGGSQETSKNSL